MILIDPWDDVVPSYGYDVQVAVVVDIGHLCPVMVVKAVAAQIDGLSDKGPAVAQVVLEGDQPVLALPLPYDDVHVPIPIDIGHEHTKAPIDIGGQYASGPGLRRIIRCLEPGELGFVRTAGAKAQLPHHRVQVPVAVEVRQLVPVGGRNIGYTSGKGRPCAVPFVAQPVVRLE